MKAFMTLTLLALLVVLVSSIPSAERKSDAEYMEIYKQCRSRFGTKPKVECRFGTCMNEQT